MNLQQMAADTVELLHRQYPDADCTLDYSKPWQLLVAAILSAQCTDARVNQITPPLFARYENLQDLAAADPAELESLVRSCGLFRTKARSILGSSRMLVEKFDGEVPRTLPELSSLPGVGRKIANLILGDCFAIPAIVVDTHCMRISRLIGLTDHAEPEAIENDLKQIVAIKDWVDYGHLMVAHGRSLCTARHPDCPHCPLNGFCRYNLHR